MPFVVSLHFNMQAITITGERSVDLADILCQEGWQGTGSSLWRQGGELSLHLSCGALLPGTLPLGPDPEKAAQILRWFTDWEIRPATRVDLEDMCQLKADRIRETFTFLSEEEREREIKAVATREQMAKEQAQNSFWVCRRDGELWALGGLQEKSKDEGLIYSGYSRGERAGAALLALCIQEAERRGYRKLWAHLYGYNEQSPGHLHYQGFRLSNRLWTSHHNPPHRIRAWMMRI